MDFIQKLAKEKGIPEDEIQEEITQKLEKYKEEKPEASEQKLKMKAATEVKQLYNRVAEYRTVEGIVLAKSNPFDMVGRQREEAKKAFKEDRDLAIAKGLTDEEGRPLYTPDTFKNVNENQIGDPLPEHLYIQNLFFLGLEDNKIYKVSATGDTIKTFKNLESNEVIKARITIQNDDEVKPVSCKLGTRGSIDVIDKDLNVIDRIEESGKVKSLGELREYAKSQKGRYNTVITSGFVSYMRLEPNDYDNRMVVIDEAGSGEERGITCWVPPHINIDFGRNSIIYVVGDVRVSEPYGDNPRGSVQINTHGMIPDPDFTESLDEELGF